MLISESTWGYWRGENNSTPIWPGDCLHPSVVMKGWSEHSLRDPPWCLISCAAPELRSDMLAHQTALSLTGTSLIARCLIIVSQSVLASGFLAPCPHVREFTLDSFVVVDFQNKQNRDTSAILSI